MENHETADDLQQQRELSRWKTCRDLREICSIPLFLVLLPAQGDSDATATLSYKGKAARGARSCFISWRKLSSLLTSARLCWTRVSETFLRFSIWRTRRTILTFPEAFTAGAQDVQPQSLVWVLEYK